MGTFILLRKCTSRVTQSRLYRPLGHQAVGTHSTAMNNQPGAHSTLPGGFEPGVEEDTVVSAE